MITYAGIRARTCDVPSYGKLYWHRYGSGFQRCRFVGYGKGDDFIVQALPAKGRQPLNTKRVDALFVKRPAP